ncbi:MAG: helix-turn-helix domain-containing protein [Pseudomonadota bacterium]
MQTAGDILQKDRNIKLLGADAFTLEGYTQVPNAILASKQLSDAAKIAYALLLSYAWQNDYCFPGQAAMGERWGKSERSVRTALKELETAGYLKVTRQGLGRTNLYHVVISVGRGKVRDKRLNP